MNFLSKLVSRELKLAAKRIDAGTCEVSEDEAIDILKVVAHEPLSKDEAIDILKVVAHEPLSKDEAIDILKVVAHEPLSKDEAMSLLNLGRSRFDDLVREGKIPKGRKRRGFKELVWYKDELLLISR